MNLTNYKSLYRSSSYMGVNELFKQHYGLEKNEVIALSVSHGVDFGHCHWPMDVDSNEPIHWSCNEYMHQEALKYKTSILAPHPWTLITKNKLKEKGNGTLLIGPPPSPENDQTLFSLIKNRPLKNWSVLVKTRGSINGSLQFWQSKGLKTLSAGNSGLGFYERLYEILNRFENIIACTYSSALFFASAIGKKIELVDNFKYSAYEPHDYEREVNLNSKRAQEIACSIYSNRNSYSTDLCQNLLGYDLNLANRNIAEEYRTIVQQLKHPVWNNESNKIPFFLRRNLALITKKPKILNATIADYKKYLGKKSISIMSMNEVDLWTNGKNSSNFHLEPTTYIRGLTEPGFAPNGYKS